jgi:hypothetical protein
MIAAMAALAIFKALMAMFQTGYRLQPWPQPAGRFLQVYPGKGKRPKAAKNKPELLQSYVTYDTVPAGAISDGWSVFERSGHRFA